MPFDEKELCPPDTLEEMTPDEQHFHEVSNEGATFERTYRRAGLVLWPRARRLAVQNHAGLRGTLPYLEDLFTRWQASGATIDSPVRREADELSRHMLGTWPREAWRRENDTNVGRALDLQVRLGNAAWIDTFLDELSAEGHYGVRQRGDPGVPPRSFPRRGPPTCWSASSGATHRLIWTPAASCWCSAPRHPPVPPGTLRRSGPR